MRIFNLLRSKRPGTLLELVKVETESDDIYFKGYASHALFHGAVLLEALIEAGVKMDGEPLQLSPEHLSRLLSLMACQDGNGHGGDLLRSLYEKRYNGWRPAGKAKLRRYEQAEHYFSEVLCRGDNQCWWPRSKVMKMATDSISPDTSVSAIIARGIQLIRRGIAKEAARAGDDAYMKGLVAAGVDPARALDTMRARDQGHPYAVAVADAIDAAMRARVLAQYAVEGKYA